MTALYVKKVEIEFFRSIEKISVEPSYLSVFVGKNDSGKSNILRALNLFFNGETDPGEPFDFATDHHAFVDRPKKAKEISIKITFDVPETYQTTNGQEIEWKKIWREDSDGYNPYVDEKVSFKFSQGARGRPKREEFELPSRSKIHQLFRNIRFIYVPAIKDANYFSVLRSQIYQVIAEVADAELRKSSNEFEAAIAAQMQDLTEDIASSLGIKSSLTLPKDLTHIFESLDFLSDTDKFSLDVRGDGIKARHIPLILKYIANKSRSLHGQGVQPLTYYWAYEEPENSLEMGNALELAQQLKQFLSEDIQQIFLTTHSPVFYNLARGKKAEAEDLTSLHPIDRQPDGVTLLNTAHDGLDESLGTAAAIAPYVAEYERKLAVIKRSESSLENMPGDATLFVEGKTDKAVFDRLLELFFPNAPKRPRVVTKESGAGVNYVADMLTAWTNLKSQQEHRERACGLLDGDPAGNDTRKSWNKAHGCKHCKIFQLPLPSCLHPFPKWDFQVHADLEGFYPEKIWNKAFDKQSWLEERKPNEFLTEAKMNDIIKSSTGLEATIPEGAPLMLRYKLTQTGKERANRAIMKLPDDEFQDGFAELLPVFKDIMQYLNLPTDASE